MSTGDVFLHVYWCCRDVHMKFFLLGLLTKDVLYIADSWETRIRHHRKFEERTEVREEYARYSKRTEVRKEYARFSSRTEVREE